MKMKKSGCLASRVWYMRCLLNRWCSTKELMAHGLVQAFIAFLVCILGAIGLFYNGEVRSGLRDEEIGVVPLMSTLVHHKLP